MQDENREKHQFAMKKHQIQISSEGREKPQWLSRECSLGPPLISAVSFHLMVNFALNEPSLTI